MDKESQSFTSRPPKRISWFQTEICFEHTVTGGREEPHNWKAFIGYIIRAARIHEHGIFTWWNDNISIVGEKHSIHTSGFNTTANDITTDDFLWETTTCIDTSIHEPLSVDIQSFRPPTY
jgi:hypothetical protein